MSNRSIIYQISSENFKSIVLSSSSASDVLRKLSLSNSSKSLAIVKNRIIEEGFNLNDFDSRLRIRRSINTSNKPVPLNEILVENSSYNRNRLKKRLLKEGILENICVLCGQLPFHNDKPLTLVLDHINGVNNDNRLNNLRILCPNCHTQTSTFAGRNSSKEKIKNRCITCKKVILKKSKYCVSCSNKRERDSTPQRRVERPSKEQLTELILNYPFTTIAKQYGVSDNAIRKWCKHYGLPYKQNEIAKLRG